ncbi:hypothetical protein SLE2022_267330 [Rubroshorea leprosula]
MIKTKTKKVRIKYERLLEFCYVYGCIWHIEVECEIGFYLKEANYKIAKFYGPWLRVKVDGWGLKDLENLELLNEINQITKELEAETNKMENRRLMVKEESSKAPSPQVSQT